MKRNPIVLPFFCFVLFLFSCKKLPADLTASNPANKTTGMITNASPPPSNLYIDSVDAVDHDGDTSETMTVLGSQLTNPYLIPNMQQAYRNLGITNVSVRVTNKYVRFKPTMDQMSYLDSFMDAKGMELYDAPLDYQILLEGDYYQDPSIPAEQPTWQYAVVPNVFTYPTGVQYETLAQIHIPGDNYTAVETEAERLAEAGGGGGLNATEGGGAEPNGILCLEGYHKDPETGQCVPNNCPANYHWDGTTCVPDAPSCPSGYYWNGSNCVPVSNNPPAPAADAAVPAGKLTLDETQQVSDLTGISTTYNTWYGTKNKLAPLQNARVVARRWFKIERVYTNAAGQFTFTKRFKHKVKINVKFKNDDAVIRCLRGVRVWNVFSPLNKVIGSYSGNKNNISYNFAQYDERHAKGNQYWVGGTVHNGLQEYKTFAQGQNIGLPPTRLYILITNWASDGATPMLHKRSSDNFPKDAIVNFVANDVNAITGGLTALTTVVKHQIDIVIGYRIPTGKSYFSKASDDIKTTIYHELTHSGHYNKLGNGWYGQFADAEVLEIVAHPFGGQYSPYGDGNDNQSPIIALGESWAYYMGHFMADLRYGLQSTQTNEQGIGYVNNAPMSGLSSHINLLEDFSPFRTTDPFFWIPQGVYQDLRDDRNDRNAVPRRVDIDDNVVNYTNQQMFNSFNSGITTLQGYRTNLLNTTTNSTSGFVTPLFGRYGY